MSVYLYTIGYEGRDIHQFVAELRRNRIDRVIDVRETPISRKAGFSKASLSARLAEEDIKYVHLRRLGTPKPLRDRLKQTGNYRSFFTQMEEYLTGQVESLDEAHKHACEASCCLLCFEKHAEECHRSLVAAKLRKLNPDYLWIVNL